MRKRSRKPEAEDVNQIAARMTRHLIDTTEANEVMSDEDTRKALARALGRLGGLKGGPARAAKMSKAERSKSASKAARSRWDKKKYLP
jgi:hypothetical protein